MPNFIVAKSVDHFGFVGWVDLGLAGIADRWQDLALFCRSLEHNGFSQAEVEKALEFYGCIFNPEKNTYYTLLDEFF